MPTKAAGTSLKRFTREYNGGRKIKDNFISSGGKELRKFMLDSLEVPKLAASHIYGENAMIELIQHATADTLHIHIYRNERDRLLSGIKEVMTQQARFNHGFTLLEKTREKALIAEDALLDQPIAKLHREIGIGNGKSLSCKVFDAMEQHAPNLIFVHYKQADALQKLLAHKFCPQITQAKHSNVDSDKTVETLEQIKNGTQVPLQDWLYHKKDVLKWALNLNTRSDCQAKTKQLETALKKCPNQVVWPLHYEVEY